MAHMTIDTWRGSLGNWGVTSNWSDGIPSYSSEVEINQGDPVVTGGIGDIYSLDIGINCVGLRITDAFPNVVSHQLHSYGDLAIRYSSLAVDGAMVSDGVTTLKGSNLFVGGPVSGEGEFDINTGSNVNFARAVSNGQAVDFASGVDHLTLGDPTGFSASISQFSIAGDSVTAEGFARASTLIAYHQSSSDFAVLTLTDGAHSAHLDFIGALYSRSDFAFSMAADGSLVIKRA